MRGKVTEKKNQKKKIATWTRDGKVWKKNKRSVTG